MYKLTNFPSIIVRIADGAHIPADPANTDYQAYLAWRDAGNDPEPYQPPPAPVPQSVTMRQARLALLGAGLLDDVDAAIAAIPDPVQRKAAQIEWEYATTVDRTSPWVANLATALGLDEAALDNLFTQAAAL